MVNKESRSSRTTDTLASHGQQAIENYLWDLEMPEDNESTSGGSSQLTRAKLISSELEGKLKAISGYDDILWKIRSGYVAILYGVPAIFLGTEGVPNLKEIVADSGRALLILLLLGGFSLSAFIIDSSYLAKKLKVIVTRDLLVKSAFAIAVNPEACVKDVELMKLLRIAGETSISKISPDAVKQFWSKMFWNGIFVLIPLYLTAPGIAIGIYVLI